MPSNSPYSKYNYLLSKPTLFPSPTVGDGLVKVEKVEFHAKRNAALHHCDKYELVNLGTPIVRRGGTFTIDLHFSGPVDLKKQHNVKLYFNFGTTTTSKRRSF